MLRFQLSLTSYNSSTNLKMHIKEAVMKNLCTKGTYRLLAKEWDTKEEDTGTALYVLWYVKKHLLD